VAIAAGIAGICAAASPAAATPATLVASIASTSIAPAATIPGSAIRARQLGVAVLGGGRQQHAPGGDLFAVGELEREPGVVVAARVDDLTATDVDARVGVDDFAAAERVQLGRLAAVMTEQAVHGG